MKNAMEREGERKIESIVENVSIGFPSTHFVGESSFTVFALIGFSLSPHKQQYNHSTNILLHTGCSAIGTALFYSLCGCVVDR